jgi:ParB/RepB/Spo0J family partition protein
MTRPPTPNILGDGSRANTDDLAAMFGPVADGERIQQIPLHALDDNPFQRRTAGYADDDASLIELSTDIAVNGIHQPLVVRRHPDQDAQHGRYQIAAGHRRRKAAHMASLETVPCVVRDLTDDAMLDVVFAENYHRADINAIDRAELMAMLIENGLTQQQIADRFSISRPTVANALRLLKLPADIQQDVVTGKISNRQAEALLPLAALPIEAQKRINGYSDMAANVERARNGVSSDTIRSHVQSAIRDATNVLPDHWRNYNFHDLAAAVQPTCAGCPNIIQVKDEPRCAMPPCWDAKSSAWQAIENRQIVELTGIPIMPQGSGLLYDGLYGSTRELLGLPKDVDGPPGHTCPNLRIRKAYGERWEWICYYGADGSKQCACRAKAEKAASADGKRAWKQICNQVEAALLPHLFTFPLDALRLLARVYGKWDQREQVHAWDAEQCIPVIATGLIKVYTPYEPEKNLASARTSMEQLLAIAGLRAPWLPPLADELSRTFADLRNEIDDYQSPGDGLPTPERMAAIMDQLNATLDSAKASVAGDDQVVLLHQYRNIWPDAIALNERVQASHAQTHPGGRP